MPKLGIKKDPHSNEILVVLPHRIGLSDPYKQESAKVHMFLELIMIENPADGSGTTIHINTQLGGMYRRACNVLLTRGVHSQLCDIEKDLIKKGECEISQLALAHIGAITSDDRT